MSGMIQPWYSSKPATDGVSTTNTPTMVDARVMGGMMQVCEFRGEDKNAEGTRKCKFYNKSDYRLCCMHYYEKIDIGACGKV